MKRLRWLLIGSGDGCDDRYFAVDITAIECPEVVASGYHFLKKPNSCDGLILLHENSLIQNIQ